VLTNVTISRNDMYQMNDCTGEMVNNNSSNPVLINVIISGSWDDGMYNMFSSNPVLTNVIISGNRGTGIVNYYSSPLLTNVTISGNYYGGMVGDSFSSPIVRNSIVWSNRFGAFGDNAMTVTVQYSDVQGGYTGTGNINADPLFASPIAATTAPTTTGDFHLQAGSPVINAGNNALVPPGVTTDRDGNPRIMGDTVDMGAYEYVAASTVDSNH
jgi:hypothetical protein